MNNIKLFEEFKNPKFKVGDNVWFRIKYDEFNNNHFTTKTIKDKISEIKNGYIFLENGYIFNEETLLLDDNIYSEIFPFEVVKLYKDNIKYI